MPTMTPVRLRVKELREAKGLRQNQLAKLADIPQGTLSKIESGQTGGVDFEILEKLADALKVDAGFLIVHDRTPTKGKR